MPDLKAIRNLDDETYRRFKARAVMDGRTVGDALNQAMREYLRVHRAPELLARAGALA